METLTRFNNVKYEHFKINFKGLVIEVKRLDDKATFPNTEDKNFCEEFKIIVTNKDKVITYKFYNSIMERDISEHLKTNLKQYPTGLLKVKEFKNFMGRKMWGGYDKVKNSKELNRERAVNLLYSVLNSLALDKNSETETFKDFCDNFGYDTDSIKAEKVYKAVQEFKSKIYDLRLTTEQEEYLNEQANQETEQFKKDVYEAIDHAI
jgi:hypothetical protein